MKEIRGKATCEVDADSNIPVTLTVTVGNAQLGSSKVHLGTKKWPAQEKVADLELGTGSDLAGKAVVIWSIVTDENESTNKMIVTYDISGAAHEFSQELGTKVEEERDSAFFEFTVEFKGA